MAFWSKKSARETTSARDGLDGALFGDERHNSTRSTDRLQTSDKSERYTTLDNRSSGVSLGTDEWPNQPGPSRDWKKLFLVIGLGVLSWVATYVGMLELIEANMGELPLVHKLIIGFSVAMLMTMIIWLLDQLFAPIGLFTKLCYAGGYIFLTLISAGFGFGFYWKVLESRSEATRGAESAISQVQGSLYAAATRLDQLNGTLVQLTAISTQKAELERTSGTSCPNSKPGDGPRRKMREDDAARFSFASDFVKGRAGSVKSEMTALDVDLAKIIKDDKSTIDAKSGTRNDYMRSLNRKLDNTVTGFNAFRTDPQLKQIRADLAERADKTTVTDSKGVAISCPDPQLATALKGVVRAIDQLPELEKPKVAAVEGSEATIEAFRRLTATFYGALSFKLPPSADELRDAQKRAVQSVESPNPAMRAASAEQVGLSKRDYVPLAIAIFVDLCLLLVSMGRPVNRLGGMLPKMRAAEQGPVIQILSRFNDIHRDKQVRENFEIFRHVVFDFNGDYYVAVPLDAPKRMNPEQREDLRLEAQLLSNLFTSFEKEKIFDRVMMPLFSTRSVQKRLHRQGSKFAESEAFRIYKFKDGAWSEIILGAIMGAAKRVEAEKRRRRIENDVFTRHEPAFGPGVTQSVTHELSHELSHELGHERGRDAERASGRSSGRGSGLPRPAVEDAVIDRAVSPQADDPAVTAAARAAVERAAQRIQTDGRRPSPPPSYAQPSFPNASNVAPHPNYAVGAARLAEMPQSHNARDVHPANGSLEAFPDVAVATRVANNNTAPSFDWAAKEADGVAHGAGADIRVTATERTVSYSVPVSEAVLPAAISQMLGRDAPTQPPTTLAPEAFPDWRQTEADAEAVMIAAKFGPVTSRS
jgi:hypothetical protein